MLDLIHHDIFKTLLRDRENSNAADKFGRMPIHLTAANHDTRFLDHLLGTGKITDIDARDLDQWTPLMWASRSDNRVNDERLLSEKAYIWNDLEPEPQQRSRLNQVGLDELARGE
ncbi:uncharacterized protein FIESC28_07251 [Fusarium coffeatum]|uniref:Uncharacterized protein n=1 Tax=Fusarium coffeatum TaxID=231269 RepID=A0A366RGV7_9HYPO|nr:uncharacterized protein FIESC28_07251 [Fusarium coffeatum]RBR15610.1 hypothetical protein FIESC28_07251 [Fusarium coffeatum]